jgi:hypothetical protein
MLTVLGVSGDIRSDAELAAIWSPVVTVSRTQSAMQSTTRSFAAVHLAATNALNFSGFSCLTVRLLCD